MLPFQGQRIGNIGKQGGLIGLAIIAGEDHQIGEIDFAVHIDVAGKCGRRAGKSAGATR